MSAYTKMSLICTAGVVTLGIINFILKLFVDFDTMYILFPMFTLLVVQAIIYTLHEKEGSEEVILQVNTRKNKKYTEINARCNMQFIELTQEELQDEILEFCKKAGVLENVNSKSME